MYFCCRKQFEQFTILNKLSLKVRPFLEQSKNVHSKIMNTNLFMLLSRSRKLELEKHFYTLLTIKVQINNI